MSFCFARGTSGLSILMTSPGGLVGPSASVEDPGMDGLSIAGGGSSLSISESGMEEQSLSVGMSLLGSSMPQ